MEKENRNRSILMKEIKDIIVEMRKKSTGVFKNKFGVIFYLLNGEFHRKNKPAIITLYGTKEWRFNGKLHRENGRPAIEFGDGGKEWWFNGLKHRADGPAVEYINGYILWYYYGKRASSEEQFYNPEWRKKIEIKVFL